jgi:ribose 5-phosphate isomerase A
MTILVLYCNSVFGQQLRVDLSDGADEVDPSLNPIKAAAARCCARRSSRRPQSGRWSWAITENDHSGSARIGHCRWKYSNLAGARSCASLNASARMVVPRKGGNSLFHADQGYMILDSRFGPIADPAVLSALPGARAGIVEHGLFIDIAHGLLGRIRLAPLGRSVLHCGKIHRRAD